MCIDSFSYYGTDELYLSYLARSVKPGGPIRIVGAGLMCEMDDPIPAHLREWGLRIFRVPALGSLVAAAQGADRHPGHRGGGHAVRWLATLDGLARLAALLSF